MDHLCVALSIYINYQHYFIPGINLPKSIRLPQQVDRGYKYGCVGKLVALQLNLETRNFHGIIAQATHVQGICEEQ